MVRPVLFLEELDGPPLAAAPQDQHHPVAEDRVGLGKLLECLPQREQGGEHELRPLDEPVGRRDGDDPEAADLLSASSAAVGGVSKRGKK